jgi:uncharacterized surface anchored protein
LCFTIAEKQTEATKVKAENLTRISYLDQIQCGRCEETLKGAEFKLLREDRKSSHPILHRRRRTNLRGEPATWKIPFVEQKTMLSN